MKKNTSLLSYFFVVLGTVGLMFPILSFILVEKKADSGSLKANILADTTVLIKFEPLTLTDTAVGKFEPGTLAKAAIDSFANLWANAPAGNIQISKSKISKSDLFSITALDSLLQISNTARNPAKFITIIKGIDTSTGELKSYLALVDRGMQIIRQSPDRTYLQDAVRCPDDCPQ